MSADDSLDLVIRFATDKRDDAVRSMADARRIAEAAATKLQLLVRYRDDYNATPNHGLQHELTDPVRMANARAFIGKLDTAIAQQQREASACEARSTMALKAMQGAEMRLKSLERLRERREEEERRAENRRDQHRNDAYAARAAREGGASLEARHA